MKKKVLSKSNQAVTYSKVCQDHNLGTAFDLDQTQVDEVTLRNHVYQRHWKKSEPGPA
jgi:hypothetical protein